MRIATTISDLSGLAQEVLGILQSAGCPLSRKEIESRSTLAFDCRDVSRVIFELKQHSLIVCHEDTYMTMAVFDSLPAARQPQEELPAASSVAAKIAEVPATRTKRAGSLVDITINIVKEHSGIDAKGLVAKILDNSPSTTVKQAKSAINNCVTLNRIKRHGRYHERKFTLPGEIPPGSAEGINPVWHKPMPPAHSLGGLAA